MPLSMFMLQLCTQVELKMRQEVEAIAAMEEQAAQLANRRAALAAQVSINSYTILRTQSSMYTHMHAQVCEGTLSTCANCWSCCCTRPVDACMVVRSTYCSMRVYTPIRACKNSTLAYGCVTHATL
jgi:hypothetical protein